MLKFFAIIALLIIPCSAISVSNSMSMPNGQQGIATGYTLDGVGHVETILPQHKVSWRRPVPVKEIVLPG